MSNISEAFFKPEIYSCPMHGPELLSELGGKDAIMEYKSCVQNLAANKKD